MTGKTLLEFPCDFPIKAFGSGGIEFESQVVAIIRRHVPDLGEAAVASRPSRRGKYTAVTVTIRARSQTQIDAIYRDLTESDDVIMSL